MMKKMEDNYKRIESNLRIGYYGNNPSACADDHAILAGEYSFLCGLMEGVLKTKSAIWNELRKNVKSDTSADRAYDHTENGLNEIGLKLRMKGAEKMLSGLKSLIRNAENEAKNIF